MASNRRNCAYSLSISANIGVTWRRFPRRHDVERANSRRLAELPDPSQIYLSVDTPGTNSNGYQITPKKADEILERLVVLKEVTLKVRNNCALKKEYNDLQYLRLEHKSC